MRAPPSTIDEYAVDIDAVWPRDAEHRYRLYARRGDELEILAAAADMASIGVAIGQIHADQKSVGRRLADLGVVGVLDAVAGEWVVLPWERREREVTFGPLPARVA